MKIKRWLLVIVILLFGCAKSEEEIAEEKRLAQEQEVDYAWSIVNAGIEKLQAVPFHGEGYTNEVAHISYGTNDHMELDTTKISGIFESYHYTITYRSAEDVDFTNRKLLFGQLENASGDDGILSVEFDSFQTTATFENLKKDYTSYVDDGFLVSYQLRGNTLSREDGKVYVCENRMKSPDPVAQGDDPSWDTIRYFNFMDLLKYDKNTQGYPGDFMNRGKASTRLIDPESGLFQVTIEERDKGKLVHFYVENSNDNRELKKYIREYARGGYSVTESDELTDEFVSAEIIVNIDAEGYVTSYDRIGIWEYEEQQVKIPYVQSFTFTRE